MPWTAANPAARWLRLGRTALAAAALVLSGASARAAERSAPVAPLIAEAAQRFDLPPQWIGGVMRRESGRRADAVSYAGALGLMQIMPRTYADLGRRYGLGADPLQPRDNVLAGAAYLRELYDRFGERGFLAAYNAGPQRYFDWLAFGRALPSETRTYADQLQRDLQLTLPITALSPPGVFVRSTAEPLSGSTVGVRARGGLFVSLGSPGQAVSHGR